MAAAKPKKALRVILAKPRGFCAGVERAIEIVEKALEIHGPPVYVRHEIVHNKRVVDDLMAKGAVFVEELDNIPDGAVTVFSAHGVSQSVEDEAKRRDLPVIDATCPLVSKVHRRVRTMSARTAKSSSSATRDTPRWRGTQGRIPAARGWWRRRRTCRASRSRTRKKVAYVTQTTLSVDDTRDVIEALKKRFPTIAGPDVKDICYATQNRQRAVHDLAEAVDVLLVVGARNSSNSNRLREIGADLGVPSYLIDDARALDPDWLEGASAVGVTAGASAPEELVQELIERLSDFGNVEAEELKGVDEKMQFKLPRELVETPARKRSA